MSNFKRPNILTRIKPIRDKPPPPYPNPPPFPLPPKEEYFSPTKSACAKVPLPSYISKESEALIHEIETNKPPSKIPEQIFEEEIIKRTDELQCLTEETSKDPLALIHEIETKKPPTEIPEQIFEEVNINKADELQCLMDEPLKVLLEEETTKKADELQCLMEEPSKEPLAFIHEIKTKRPRTEIPEQIFAIMHEIETRKPPTEIPEQIFEEETTKRPDELQCLMEEPPREPLILRISLKNIQGKRYRKHKKKEKYSKTPSI